MRKSRKKLPTRSAAALRYFPLTVDQKWLKNESADMKNVGTRRSAFGTVRRILDETRFSEN